MLLTYTKEPTSTPQGCVIWLHGLGSNAADMKALAQQQPKLTALALRHVFVDAPKRPITLNNGMSMQAWYDITGFTLGDREDETGILQSQHQLKAIIDAQINTGLQSSQIFLAGFSQGGAMALFTALHCSMPLAGVVALSSYLPLSSTCQSILSSTTPIFIAHGQFDPVVLPQWTKLSETWLRDHGYQNLSCHQYPMQHTICVDEIDDLSRWFTQHLSKVIYL